MRTRTRIKRFNGSGQADLGGATCLTATWVLYKASLAVCPEGSGKRHEAIELQAMTGTRLPRGPAQPETRSTQHGEVCASLSPPSGPQLTRSLANIRSKSLKQPVTVGARRGGGYGRVERRLLSE